MKPAVLLLAIAFAFSMSAGTRPTISGQSPNEFGSKAEKIWTEQLNLKARGISKRAEIRAVRGSHATFIRNSQNVRARVGQALDENETLKTGPDTHIDLYLGDNGPVLRVLENSTVNIVRLRSDFISETEKVTDTMIELQKGRLVGNVKKQAAASSYLIRTPRSVLQIRGTQFAIQADGQVEVKEGAAQLFTGDESYRVETEERFVPGKGVKKIQ